MQTNSISVPKRAKKPLLTRNRSQDSRVGRCAGWASTRGLHELRIRPLRAMEIRPAQSLADSGKELQGFFLRQNGVLRMTRDPRLRYSRKVDPSPEGGFGPQGESQESTVEESKTFRPLNRLSRKVDPSPEGGFGRRARVEGRGVKNFSTLDFSTLDFSTLDT